MPPPAHVGCLLPAACQTKGAGSPRPEPVGRGGAQVIEAAEDTTWLRRVRSAVLLVLLLTAIGVLVAAVIGAGVVLMVSLLDQALA